MSTQNNWYELHFNKNEPSKVMESADVEKVKAEGIKLVESLGEDNDDYCWIQICVWTPEEYQEALVVKLRDGNDELYYPSDSYIYSKKRRGWFNSATDATL